MRVQRGSVKPRNCPICSNELVPGPRRRELNFLVKTILAACLLCEALTFAQAAPTTQISPEGCTVDRFTVYSPGMGREIKAAVILPPEYKDQPEKKYPILYAFHGTDGPYDAFAQMAPLRQALKSEPMIVTCLDGDARAFLLDSPLPQTLGRNDKSTAPVKYRFSTFFLREFIPAIDKLYRVNHAQRMLTGYSAGGYSALHFMAARPGEFVAVSSMSGWFKSWLSLTPGDQDWFKPLLGPYAENQKRYAAADIYTQVKKARAAGLKFPPIYLTCGTGDDLLNPNRDMNAFLNEQGIPCEYQENPGIHNFDFWTKASEAIIDFHWRALQKK
jgi:S-formylglutathione hydrolase FrmB